MEFQGNDHKNDSPHNASSADFTSKKKENEAECKNPNYSCPIEWSFYEHPTITTENESLVIFLEKAKNITTDLLIEYVNLADSDNGTFMIQNCYSIQELEQCENLNLSFNTFIESTNLLLKDCDHIVSPSDHEEIVNNLYRTLRQFLRRHLSFLMEHDYEKFEISITKGQATPERIIDHLHNTDCQLEELFLRYMKRMYNLILKMIQDPNLNPNKHSRLDIIRLMKEGETWLKIKISRLKNNANNKKDYVEQVDSAEKKIDSNEKDIFSAESYLNDMNEDSSKHVHDEKGEYIDEYYEDRFEMSNVDQDISDDDTDIIESEQEFNRATQDLLKLISNSSAQTSPIDYSRPTFEVHNTTHSNLGSVDISNTTELDKECVKNITDLWMIITGLSIGFIAVASLIKCSVKLYKSLKKRSKKVKEHVIVSNELLTFMNFE